MRLRSFARRCLIVAAWITVGALASNGLSAHAGLLLSDPLDGATLAESPEAIRLVFSEPAEPSLSDLRITDVRGNSIQVGRPGRVPDDPRALTVRVTRLDRGVYIVNWRIVSAVDGHATTGSFAFGVQTNPRGSRSTSSSSSPVSWMEVSARWLFTGGLVLLMGAAVAAVLRFGGPSDLRLAGGGWVAATVGVMVLVWIQRKNAGVPYESLASTFIGQMLIWRILALGAAGGSLLVARASSARVRHLAMAAAAVAVLACAGVHVATGHAAARGLLPPLVAVIIQWTHFVAVGIWLGGLAALLVGVRGAPSESKAAAVSRFSTAGAIGLLVVLTSGFVRALGELTAWKDLLVTTYGRALSIKVALTVAIAAFGAMNRWRSVIAAPTSLRPLRRFGYGELALAASALAAAAVLTSVAPPAAAERSSSALVVSGADYGTTVRATLTAASDLPGPNRYKVQVVDYDSKRRVEAKRVSLRFVSIEDPFAAVTALVLAPVDDGSYVGSGANLAFAGRWRVHVMIERAEGSVDVPLELETRQLLQDVSIARIPGQPPTYTVEVERAGFVRISPVPESAGDSKLYVTCYSILHDEVGIEWITVTTETADGARRQWPVQLLRRSRFVADATLVHGLNRITVIARTVQGVRLRATLELLAPQ